MKFCPACGNILYPKDEDLYCKACDKEYTLPEVTQDEYKNIKVIQKGKNVETPVAEESVEEKITERDREAHEDHFGMADENI